MLSKSEFKRLAVSAPHVLHERIVRLEGELEDMKLRNRLLRERPDLPIDRLKAYDELIAKYQALLAFYDKHVGTPCEEIRHKQEVERLEAERDKIRELLAEAYQRMTRQRGGAESLFLMGVHEALGEP